MAAAATTKADSEKEKKKLQHKTAHGRHTREKERQTYTRERGPRWAVYRKQKKMAKGRKTLKTDKKLCLIKNWQINKKKGS
jgi:hypothetical protein